MTENKRFTVDGLTITENSPKGSKYLLEYQGGVNALCSRINGLFEKSKRLENGRELLKLKEQIRNLEQTKDFCSEYCERLEKENEQLKSEIREEREAYEQLWMRFLEDK